MPGRGPYQKEHGGLASRSLVMSMLELGTLGKRSTPHGQCYDCHLCQLILPNAPEDTTMSAHAANHVFLSFCSQEKKSVPQQFCSADEVIMLGAAMLRVAAVAMTAVKPHEFLYTRVLG